jgi:hypothetical protein
MIDIGLLAKIRARAHEGKRQMKAQLRHMKEDAEIARAEMELLIEEFQEQGIDITQPEGFLIFMAYLEAKGKSLAGDDPAMGTQIGAGWPEGW